MRDQAGVQDGAFEEKELINLCSNNYLGLCNHPSINEAAIQAIKVCIASRPAASRSNSGLVR